MVHRTVYIMPSVAILVLAIYVKTGLCIVLDLAIPEPGTTIANFANDSMELNFFCRLLRDDDQMVLVTNWFFLSAENREQGLEPGSVLPDDPRFTLSGDDIATESFNLSSNTNLTVNRLTTNLHNSTISCRSGDETAAEYTILVYDNPSIPLNLTITLDDLFATISWEPPTDLGSPVVSFYSLVISDDALNDLRNETVPAAGPTVFTATGLLPLTNYTVELEAVSQDSPVLVISPTVILEFATNTSVPLVNCTSTRISANQTNVLILWDVIHTGGLELISSDIEYSTNGDTNFTPAIFAMINITEGEATLTVLPTAGLNYLFRVTAENSEGESVPGECPLIFLDIGTPTTPDTPTVVADGPVALLTLRTAVAGTGNSESSLSLSFLVLVFRINSTDNSRQLIDERTRFSSSEYTNNQSVTVHVEDIMELNQIYQFVARAFNIFGVSLQSGVSDPVLLNVSVPTISSVEVQLGVDGITVTWDFLHTGGVELDQVEVLLRDSQDADESPFQLVPEGNITQPSDNSFLIGGGFLKAGQSYQVAVQAENEFGVSERIKSKILESPVGVPAVPLTPTLLSSNATSITLILHTSATGLVGDDEMFTFRLRVTATDDNGRTETTFQEDMFPGDISGETVQFLVAGVVTGSSYIFSVQAENKFGSSEYSRDSESISIDIEDDDPSDDGLGMRELIGIVVGGAIVVMMIVLCCILLLCAFVTRGGKSRKHEDNGMELQDNSLYDKDMNNRRQQDEAEFPPEAFESQYEPTSDEDLGGPTRPKPTHPQGPLEQPQPVYDTLNPSSTHQQTMSTSSIGSGRELANPLYSGIPSSRPTSQLQDSGNGTVRSMGTTKEEPLYSEANNNKAVYTHPDMRVSQTSQLGLSPPPPPDPRNIPTGSSSPSDVPDTTVYDPLDAPDPTTMPAYAEAGPGNQEHMYTELPDTRHHDKDSSPSRPFFHVPPPPPSSEENSGEFQGFTQSDV